MKKHLLTLILAALLTTIMAAAARAGADDYLQRLADFLSLTAVQTESVRLVDSEWWAYRYGAELSFWNIQTQIQAEERRSSPSPLRLGRLRVEQIHLMRQVSAERINIMKKLRGLLTQEQLSKLATLEKAIALQEVAYTAMFVNFFLDPREALPTSGPVPALTATDALTTDEDWPPNLAPIETMLRERAAIKRFETNK